MAAYPEMPKNERISSLSFEMTERRPKLYTKEDDSHKHGSLTWFAMPHKTFPAVISFEKNNTKASLLTNEQQEEDFAQRIADAVEVQEIDTNLYMSKELWLPPGARGVFGGQIVAQALRAAFHTVPKEFHVHSLHSYFILPGNVEYPVVYQVQRLRDGRSFATRFLTASQRGQAIFVCSFSFAKADDSITLEHQAAMPQVPGPENLPSETERMQKVLESDLPPKYREYVESRIEETSPIDFRDVYQYTTEELFSGTTEARETQHRWFKTRGKLSDDPRLHACIIAYASDSAFIGTAAVANGIHHRGVGMMASLDHSMWFHAPARVDDWLLYEMHSPRTSEGRGVAFGRLYTRDGTLVVTTAQEGIVRLSRREQERRRKQRESQSELIKASSSSRL